MERHPSPIWTFNFLVATQVVGVIYTPENRLIMLDVHQGLLEQNGLQKLNVIESIIRGPSQMWRGFLWDAFCELQY